ncbi:MAG: GGDEF domain-containing protein [Candidatus Omnitrophica bacterium]|nr:GGDEF domain-containing protein [Candidatus Omnitrophota bacterium]MBU1128036.1 GGDEF domain-containing protein [Candidatus Omnitrophota bacterium]MBU1851817.1 GGDEF domain-containing protein [Candidatus Omnitrophota bacterium]
MRNIHKFVEKYDEIPFLTVNFIYQDDGDVTRSVIGNVKEIDILRAEYVYPIKYGSQDIGTLMIYDINKEYAKGMQEYRHILNITRLFFVLLLFLLLSILLYREYSTKIEQEKRIAEYQAVHDGLTGLNTHKYFREHLAQAIMRAQRYKRPVSLIMCDVDHFKDFNDKYGHLAGDEVLRAVSTIIADNVRASDIVARYGGEEFAVLLMEIGGGKSHKPGKTKTDGLAEEALDIAKRIKKLIGLTQVRLHSTEANVTISMGISTFTGKDDYKPEYLISEADLALYESKNNGRNRITVFDPATKQFTEYQ